MMRMHALTSLLRRASWHDTALLLAVMLAARLTEGVGLLMIVPMIDGLYGGSGTADATPATNPMLGRIFAPFGQTPGIGTLLLAFIALITLRGLLMMAQQMLAMRYQNLVVDRLRGETFNQLMRAEWRWLSARRTSDHVALLTVGANRIAVGVNQLLMLAAQLAALIAYGIAALILAWQVALCAGLAGMALHVTLSRHRLRVVRMGQDIGEAQRAVQAEVQEGLDSVRLAKILRGEARLTRRFSDAVGRLRASQIAFTRSNGWGQLGLQVGGAAALAALLYVGKLWFALPLSVLLATILIVARLIPAFSAAQQSYHQWLHATPALAEFDALLVQSRAAAEPQALSDGEAERIDIGDAVRIDGVSLHHSGRDQPILDGLSLVLAARTTTLLTGASGAGKSTLADVLMGLSAPDHGTISVDGAALTGAARQRWRASVAYVEQDGFLFHDTIRANLYFARPQASEAEMVTALRRASAEFVLALPDGIDTVIGDRGNRLSGGERQRLALARALLCQPSLLILDEATSALDEANAAQVRQTIDQLAGTVTMLIIAHRSDGWGHIDQRLHLTAGKAVAA